MVAYPAHPMLPQSRDHVVAFPAEARPKLVVIIDAEEEFDWNKPFSSSNRSVKTIASQFHAQRIFERYRVKPTYAVDYPVASQEDGYKPLRELMQSGVCDIGAQLHPWVTPPHEEKISERNSFPGNLPAELERNKLLQLTDSIERAFGIRPTLYRAGRYGAGAHTSGILRELGYQIDCSVIPGQSAGREGPDYSGGIVTPYWLDCEGGILELPVTVATVGIGGQVFEDSLYSKIASPLGRTFRLPAVFARSGLLERIRLTPEGTTLIEAKRLTRRMHAAGHKVFAISYHTPSLVPGNTRYVRNQSELETFLAWIEGYFEFFFTEIGGEAMTPFAIRDWSLSLLTRQRTEPSGRTAVARAASDVSVVIPAHNSSATLARALDSVLAQTVQPREIVVVDDCSKDDTIKLAQSYADNGVRVVALDKQSGAAGARNAGIYAAKGEYIAFLDSDDEWLPTKLEKQMTAMETDKNLSLISCASNLILPNGTDCGDVYGGRRPTVGPLAWKALLISNYIATPTVVARRDHLISLGGFDRNLKIGEDQDMWIRLALVGNVGFIFESLVRVHERENSLSNWNFDEQLLYTMPMIEKHIRQLSDRLTPVDIRRIKGERIGRLGRVAHGRGKRMKGAQMILEATWLGYRPVENFYYLMTASPPITWLKFVVRRLGV